jgi:putative ABC transport system ATP-binding protein
MTSAMPGAHGGVSLREVTVRYTRGDQTVTPIDGLTVDIEPGSLVLLLGPSGCGKTTLLSCLAGIMRPTSGVIEVDGRDITSLSGVDLTQYRRHGVGIVFQAFNLIASLDAVENVAVALRSAGRSRREARERAVALLTEVGLGQRLAHRPSDLSGGQQQRVAIARALALDPGLLVADEPTANLDAVQVETVLRILRSLTGRGRTVVVSTHDHRLLPLADRVIDMSNLAGPPPSTKQYQSLVDGETLFRQGQMGSLIFEVVSGAIELRRLQPDGSEWERSVAGPGEFFGEMGALFELPRSATARAIGPTEVVARTVDDFRATHGAERLKELVGRFAALND